MTSPTDKQSHSHSHSHHKNQPNQTVSHTPFLNVRPSSISFTQLWQREWQVKQQGKLQWLYPLLLFLMIMNLFPLTIGTEPEQLQRLGTPAVWIAAMLSLLMGVEELFRPAFSNGTLAQLVVARASLPLWVLIRLLIHWLFSGAIVALLSLLSVPLFAVSWDEAGILMLSILVGSPMLLMLSATASALTLSLKNAVILVPLLALPLQLPILIFATGAVNVYTTGMNALPILALLLAGSLTSIMVLPWVMAHILKMAWLS